MSKCTTAHRLSKTLQYKQLIAELFQSPLSSHFAQLIGTEIYQNFVKNFWNLWTLHLQNINELTLDEDKIRKSFEQNKQLLDSFDSKKKLPFSLLTLRHIHLTFLCHCILQHLQWQSFGMNKEENNNESDIEMNENEEEKASMVNDDNVIASIITRCMRNHRPFDLNYKVVKANGTDVKYTKIRYISMEHCALIVVNDEELMRCNVSAPKVKIALNTYIDSKGNIKNLSGRHSLIKLLCKSIVRRAVDPFATTSTALGFMNSKIFSIDMLCQIFDFMEWRDLLSFGYCSHLAYNMSNESELWKLMFSKVYGHPANEHVTNWKNKFLTFHLKKDETHLVKSGKDKATLDLIRRLMQN